MQNTQTISTKESHKKAKNNAGERQQLRRCFSKD